MTLMHFNAHFDLVEVTFGGFNMKPAILSLQRLITHSLSLQTSLLFLSSFFCVCVCVCVFSLSLPLSVLFLLFFVFFSCCCFGNISEV